MAILTVNAGSSSIRLAAFTYDRELHPLAAEHYPGKADDLSSLLEGFLREKSIPDVKVVAHRIVHGGPRLTAPCLLDNEVEAEIRGLSKIAPLHNPPALAAIAASRGVMRRAVQVAVFDTAFYIALPEVASTYALPRALCLKHGIRRYGFHGLAHQAMWRRWTALQTELKDGGRVISLQLGAGCSMTAISHGQPVDTSMGFSPLEGLVMATRSGDVDPGLLAFLQRAENLTLEELERLLNDNSGLFGISGISAEMKRLLDMDSDTARLAIEVYCHRARKYLGAYLAVMGGADAVLFGGGVGENAVTIREKILAGMEWAGISLDWEKNRATVRKKGCISRHDSKTEVWVIPVDEAAIMAQEALSIIAYKPPETRGRKDHG